MVAEEGLTLFCVAHADGQNSGNMILMLHVEQHAAVYQFCCVVIASFALVPVQVIVGLMQGFYDRGKELNWKNMKDIQFVGAMGPPGGARNMLDPRFVSLFDVFEVQFPSNTNLQTIYTSILAHHVASLSEDIRGKRLFMSLHSEACMFK